MNWLRFRKITNRVVTILFCLALFLYTMAFPGNTSWFILIFFVLLFTLVFSSTVFSFGKAEASLTHQPDYTKDLHIEMWTRLRLPILIPTITIRLRLKNHRYEQKQWPYFRNRLKVHFENIQLPRGYYSQIEVETYGKDHFAFFTHQAIKKIPVSFEVYPELFPPKYRHYLVQKLLTNPYLKRYLKSSAAEFRQIRDYIPQDALKHVDWKSSSRKGKLMVKEYEKEVQPTITLVFFGNDSPQFESFLRLTYTIYETLHDALQVRFILLGNFNQQTEQKEDKFSFLTVQPSTDTANLLEYYRKLRVPQGYMIVVAPDDMVERMKQQRSEQVIYFTESDLREMEVSSSS